MLTKKSKSVAAVADECGGTTWIIAIEDFIEELFRKIEDEHDSNEEIEEKDLVDGFFIFTTRLNVEYLNGTFKFAILESDSFKKLRGFISFYKRNSSKRKGDYHW